MWGLELWQWLAVLVGGLVGFALLLVSAVARFVKRPSPSEAIIRTGPRGTSVVIGRGVWVVPIVHRAATIPLSTIGLTIKRAGHDALVSQDFISMNLSAEFYVRVEPNEDDVKKAARTIGIEDGKASEQAMRGKAQELLEPKLVGALRAVAAQQEFLRLHMAREDFAQEVGKALVEDLGRNGFTLESVTITELTQTPLDEMRKDDIFGASGRQTVTNTVVEKNIAVKKKLQEEAQRTAEIQKEQELMVARENRLLREGKAAEEQAAVVAELAKNEAIEARDLRRQALIALERAQKEQTEESAAITKQKAIAEAEAQKAAAVALREKAQQEVLTVERVSEAERQKRIALVAAEQKAAQERLAADVEAYKQKLRAQAEAEAAEAEALSITRLAEARREAGLKEAEVQREKIAAGNAKSETIVLAETVQQLLAQAPAIVRELVKPAERIGEIKVLQLGGLGGGGANAAASPLLGSALAPVAKTMLETSAVLPLLKELGKFVQPAEESAKEKKAS